jgi:hypothetical protein
MSGGRSVDGRDIVNVAASIETTGSFVSLDDTEEDNGRQP